MDPVFYWGSKTTDIGVVSKQCLLISVYCYDYYYYLSMSCGLLIGNYFSCIFLVLVFLQGPLVGLNL